jgi:hypothetical protein
MWAAAPYTRPCWSACSARKSPSSKASSQLQRQRRCSSESGGENYFCHVRRPCANFCERAVTCSERVQAINIPHTVDTQIKENWKMPSCTTAKKAHVRQQTADSRQLATSNRPERCRLEQWPPLGGPPKVPHKSSCLQPHCRSLHVPAWHGHTEQRTTSTVSLCLSFCGCLNKGEADMLSTT